MPDRPWHHHYDDGVPAAIDFESISIPGYLARTAERFPDRTALVFSGTEISYRRLHDEVRRLATALARLGVERDTRVAIQMPNLPQGVIAYYAALSLGAQVVMTNPLYTPRELEHQWRDAGCRVAVVADFLYASKLAANRDRLGVEHYVVASIPEYLRFPLNLLAPFKLKRKSPPLVADVPEGDGVHHFRRLVRRTRPAPPAVEIDPDSPALLQYTGGTTGVSKGAVLTHANVCCNVQQINTWFTSFRPGQEVMLTILPMFHVFGLTVSVNWPISAGATLVLQADPRDVRGMIDNIERYRVTVLPAVPAMFNAVNNAPGIEARDLSSVQACFSGSAPLPDDVLKRFEALTGARILEGFGLTETSPVTHVNPLAGERKVGSIGLPVPSTDCRIVSTDDGEADVEPGSEGELLVRGPQVMQGYWRREDETAQVLRDGWLYTGDLATVDEDGYFRIVGRKKDMIIAGGYNIYPDEVDDVLMAHPDVLEAATIGVPHERRGETVKSFVVLCEGRTATADDLTAWCREQLAAYKVPRAIEFLDELPKSPVMKVLRRELREREVARRSGGSE